MSRVVAFLITARNAAGRAVDQARAQVRALGKSAQDLRSSFAGLAAAGAIFVGLKAAIGGAFRAADELVKATRRLEGTAKLTGASLGELEALAARGRTSYALAAGTASDLAAQLTLLASKAGDVGQANGALDAFLDIGAAKGLNAEETLQAVSQAILGIDEGTDKLFAKNPSAIYAQFAEKIGTTAGKLTDQEKAQALLDAAFTGGARVRGEYASWLESTAGKQARSSQAAQEFAAQVGLALDPLRRLALDVGAQVLQWLTAFVGGLQIAAIQAGEFTRTLDDRVRLGLASILEALTDFGGAAQEVLARFFGVELGDAILTRMNETAVRLRREGLAELGASAVRTGEATADVMAQFGVGRPARASTAPAPRPAAPGDGTATDPMALRPLDMSLRGGPSARAGRFELRDVADRNIRNPVALPRGAGPAPLPDLAISSQQLAEFDAMLPKLTAGFDAFGDAVTAAFAAVIDGSMSAGEAFAVAIQSAIAQAAQAKAQYYFAEAAGALGTGLLTKDPGAFAAAAKFAAAGAAFAAIGGALQGSVNRSARGVGGVGGGAFGVVPTTPGPVQPGGGTIVIEGDFVDWNPRQADILARGLSNLTGRNVVVRGRSR